MCKKGVAYLALGVNAHIPEAFVSHIVTVIHQLEKEEPFI